MTAIKHAVSIACLALAALSTSAAAQTSDDVRNEIRRGAQLEDALRQVVRQRAAGEDGAIIDGEGGVYLLERADIFSAGALSSFGYDSNPARQNDSESGSFYGSISVFSGVDTRIANSVDVGFSATANITEYVSSAGPNGASLIGNLYASKGVLNDKVILTLAGYAGVNADGNFENDASFYGLSFSGSSLIPITNAILVRPTISVNRQLSSVSEQANWAVSTRVDGIWQITRRWRTGAYANYSRRMYDDFFEDVTLTNRNDNILQFGASGSYQLAPRANVTLVTSYTKQFSSFFLSEYEAFGLDLTGRVEFQF